jgi:hypothetical protein
MVGNSANSFEVSIEPIDNKRANVAGMVAAYSQLFGSKMQKSSLRLSSGQSATVLSMSDDSVPIHAMKIFFALNGNFYTISEGGPTYYNSPTFTQFYNSFEINN